MEKRRGFMLKKIFKKTDGVTLVEALVAIGLLSISISGLLLTVNSTLHAKKIKSVKSSLISQKEKIIETINSRNGWKNTVDQNNILCLKSTGINCASGSNEIAIYDGTITAGTFVKLTDVNANNLGFLQNQDLCNFSNADCEYRYLVSWKPICESGATCIRPLIEITGTLDIKTSVENVVLNKDLYSFKFIRGTLTSNSFVNCESLGGTFNTGTGQCELNGPGQVCPIGQIVVGLNANGTIICDALLDSACAPGEWARGVNPDGTLMCRPFVPGTCPAVPPTNGPTSDPTTIPTWDPGFSGDGGGGCGDGGC